MKAARRSEPHAQNTAAHRAPAAVSVGFGAKEFIQGLTVGVLIGFFVALLLLR